MTTSVNQRVLVVDVDARVRAAVAALIDATPGLQVAATLGSTADAVAIGRLVGATIAVVDVDTGNASQDLRVRELAEHLAVIAVCSDADGRRKALEAGAIAVCDKNGDPDALTAAVEAAARTAPEPAPTTDVGAGESAALHPNPTPHQEKPCPTWRSVHR